MTFMDKGPDGTPAFPLATVSFDDLGRVGRIGEVEKRLIRRPGSVHVDVVV